MAEHLHNAYTEALNAAEEEAVELEQEIVQLRKVLSQLDTRKRAVDEVCSALGRWVALSVRTPDQEDPFEALFDEGETIRLSEEEVSLIAYPDGPSDESS